MTDIARAERIAIMTIDGGTTEQEAEDYCNQHPEIYGIKGEEMTQGGLF